MTKHVNKASNKQGKNTVALQTIDGCIQKKTVSRIAEEKNPPSFKPGNTPHLQYGKEVLNANVPWSDVLNEICLSGMALTEIASRLEVSVSMLRAVATQHYENLNFKTGARLLTLHMQHCAAFN